MKQISNWSRSQNIIFQFHTVNCARILKPNHVAKNGMVHVIDRVSVEKKCHQIQI